MTPVRPNKEVTGAGVISGVDEGSSQGEEITVEEREQEDEASRRGEEADEVRGKRAPNQPSEKNYRTTW